MCDDPLWFSGEVLKIKKSVYQSWFSMTDFKTDDDFWFFLDRTERWYREQPSNIQNIWFQELDKYFRENIPYHKRPAAKMSEVKAKIKELEATQDGKSTNILKKT